MKDWSGTLTLRPEQVDALEAFIRESDTRESDIFDHGSLGEHGDVRIDWIIKHDLFEGVVVHWSLMSADGTTFLGGAEKSLQEANDLFDRFTLSHDGHDYDISVGRA